MTDRTTTTNGDEPHYHTIRAGRIWTTPLATITGGGHYHLVAGRSNRDGSTETGPAMLGDGVRPDHQQHTHHWTP